MVVLAWRHNIQLEYAVYVIHVFLLGLRVQIMIVC